MDEERLRLSPLESSFMLDLGGPWRSTDERVMPRRCGPRAGGRVVPDREPPRPPSPDMPDRPPGPDEPDVADEVWFSDR